MNYLVSGNIPLSVGNHNPYIMPYSAFEAQDGVFVVAVGSETQWKNLCKVHFKESEFSISLLR
jgi:crotonobetainyl-CoA:carnitine CoA-transferase CaiB-like acyl-CoA transferase